MHWYHVTLIVMALIAIFASHHVKNALLYIGLGVASYVTSVLWHNYNMPVPVLYGAITNVIVCCVIYYRAACSSLCLNGKTLSEIFKILFIEMIWGNKEFRQIIFPRWERFVFRLFIMMLLIDLLFSAGVIRERLLFAECLEVANALALIAIASPGIFDRLKRYGDDSNMHHWRLMDHVHNFIWDHRAAFHAWWRHW